MHARAMGELAGGQRMSLGRAARMAIRVGSPINDHGCGFRSGPASAVTRVGHIVTISQTRLAPDQSIAALASAHYGNYAKGSP